MKNSERCREVAAIVWSIQYKPGWSIDFKPYPPRTTSYVGYVQITTPMGPPSPDSGQDLNGRQRRDVPVGMKDTESEIIAAVYEQILSFEIHEAGEWFSYHNRRPFNPHKLTLTPQGVGSTGTSR